MNNSKTPKIVVGVGLAAFYAAGLGYFTLRGPHDNVSAPPTASSTQLAADTVPPTDVVPALADAATSVEQPAAISPAPTAEPATIAAVKPAASPSSGDSAVTSRSREQALASSPAATPAQASAIEKSNPISDSSTAVNEPPKAPVEASSAQASAPTGNDSQITADVKSQIAAVVPAGAIDVTTKDGVVELTGSVPSEEVIDKARLAARNVSAVRDVDVSALTVNN